MSTQTKTILISGGHLTPALATIEYFQKNHPEVRLLFVGRRFSQEKERQLAREEEVMQELNIPFFNISAPKFHRTNWWRNIEEVSKILPAFSTAFHLLQTENVDLFLSFGGYIAVPFAMAAKMLRKKVVTHEQTQTTGLANEVIAFFADKVAVSFPETEKFFPPEKTILTGNPLRSSILRTYTRPPSWVPDSKKPILYITGGSQGSQVINNAVKHILPELTERFLVIHQCGQSEHNRYLIELQEAAENLPQTLQDSYVPREWIEEKEVSWLFQHAAIAVARSGANTALEISLHALPTIFIPLPFSHNDEQTKNAESLAEKGAALILEQKDLTPDKLRELISDLSAQRAHIRRRAEKIRSEIQTDGAKQLGELCLSLLRS